MLRAAAIEVGFSRVGFAAARDLSEDRARMQAWLDAGMHGQMHWLARDLRRRTDPGEVVPAARTVIMLALDYDTDNPRSVDPQVRAPDRGWISRYAWGSDYHRVAERRLKQLALAVERDLAPALGVDFRGPEAPPGPFVSRRDFRFYVDHGPVLERRWGQEAGLGWQGRNGLLIDPRRGSFFFLASVVTSIAFQADVPARDRCGRCRACVDACPTGALLPGRVLDARRCISYLTIETRGVLNSEQRQLIGQHVFGCDICQDVCPYNRFSRPCGEPAFDPRPGNLAPQLGALAEISPSSFDERFARSPIRRLGVEGLRANARSAIGNAAPADPTRESRS